MIHGLSPANDTQAHSLRPDYPVCIFGAGLSGPDYWDNPGPIPRAARGSLRGGRIIRPGQAGLSGLNLLLLQHLLFMCSVPPPLPCLGLGGVVLEHTLGISLPCSRTPRDQPSMHM